jgi:hypothetical protein
MKIVVFFRFVFPIILLIGGAFLDRLGQGPMQPLDSSTSPPPITLRASDYVYHSSLPKIWSSLFPKISIQSLETGDYL